jgi:hypothetical protein
MFCTSTDVTVIESNYLLIIYKQHNDMSFAYRRLQQNMYTAQLSRFLTHPVPVQYHARDAKLTTIFF